jgi:hypothetical protein
MANAMLLSLRNELLLDELCVMELPLVGVKAVFPHL